jgi:hypothetical protein
VNKGLQALELSYVFELFFHKIPWPQGAKSHATRQVIGLPNCNRLPFSVRRRHVGRRARDPMLCSLFGRSICGGGWSWGFGDMHRVDGMFDDEVHQELKKLTSFSSGAELYMWHRQAVPREVIPNCFFSDRLQFCRSRATGDKRIQKSGDFRRLWPVLVDLSMRVHSISVYSCKGDVSPPTAHVS